MSPPLSHPTPLRLRHLALYLLIFLITPIITYILGKWFDTYLQLPQTPPFPYNFLIGFTIFFSGLTIGIRASRQLLTQGQGLPWGELSHDAQSTHLVTNGFYAYCRNPVTLGYTLLPCGMGLMFQSLGMSIVIPLIVLCINVVWLKGWEEPRLAQRFGSTYQQYRQKTPFLLPRLSLSSHLTELQNLIRGQTSSSSRLNYILYAGFSLLGVMLLILLAYSSSLPSITIPYQHLIIILGFDLICIGGIIASLYPSLCSHLIFQQTLHQSTTTPVHQLPQYAPSYPRHGHHPDCENYASHVLSLHNKRYCAGCLGLMIGAIVGIGGSIPLLFGLSLSQPDILLWTGAGFIVLGILQHQLSFNNNWIHFLLNIVFVLGPLLQLHALFTLNPSLTIELYLLTLIIFWIITRITLSQIEHARICQTCTKPCKPQQEP